jgi:hypothetical protein
MNEDTQQPVENSGSKLSFSERLFGVPSEESLYEAHFNRDFWSLEQFSALMGGISPERYKKILEDEKKIYSSSFLRSLNVYAT